MKQAPPFPRSSKEPANKEKILKTGRERDRQGGLGAGGGLPIEDRILGVSLGQEFPITGEGEDGREDMKYPICVCSAPKMRIFLPQGQFSQKAK